jgi:septum formation protein
MKEIILASGSVYRKELLKRLGIAFKCIPSSVDESILKSNVKDPVTLAKDLSVLKAQDLAQTYPDQVIIGSDQVCFFKDQILSKSGSKEKSFDILKVLSSNEHTLATAYTIIYKDKIITKVNETNLKMKSLSDEMIRKYIELDNPVDCAGSYKLELHGISLFESIETTDQTAIIGLPLIELGQDLESLGVSLLTSP